MDKQEKKGLAIGAAIGAVFGVIGGILFAPKSGKETRADIKNTTLKAAHKVQEETEELVQKAKSLSGKAADSAKKHVEGVKHAGSNLKEAVSAFRAGKASDADLDAAVKKAKEAQESLKNFLKK